MVRKGPSTRQQGERAGAAAKPQCVDTYTLQIICGTTRFSVPLSKERAWVLRIDPGTSETIARSVLLDVDGVTFTLEQSKLKYVPEWNGAPWVDVWRALCDLANSPFGVSLTDPDEIRAALAYTSQLSKLLSPPRRGKGRPKGTGLKNERLDYLFAVLRAATDPANAGGQPHHKYSKPTLKDGSRAVQARNGKAGIDSYSSDRQALLRWIRRAKPSKP